MSVRDEIKNIIVKSVESASIYDLADVYAQVVYCGICPYRNDCRNDNPCDEYIYNKLQNEVEEAEKSKRIKIGDEVYTLDQKYHSVVTCIFDGNAVMITQNGKWNVEQVNKLHRTGRHFPEILEVLEKLKVGSQA